MKSAIPLFTALLGCASITQAQPVELHTGEPFIKARARLHAAGWRPDPQSHASSGEYMGLDRLLVQSGYVEVDYCSVGESFCTLQYVRGKACLRLQTQGEQVQAMRVERWSADCRERGENEQKYVLPADVRYLIQWKDDCEKFGQCRGLDVYARKVERKYAHDRGVLAIIKTYESPAEVERKLKRQNR